MKTHKGKQVFIAVFIAVFTLIMSGMFAPGETVQSESVKLKVLLLPYLSFAPFFIAQEEGYFAEQGLEVEFIKMSSGPKAIPALVQGDLDVAAGTVGISALNAISRGGTLKVVADKGHLDPMGCAYNGLLLRKSLVQSNQLGDPFQLKTRKVGMQRLTPDEYYIEKLLKEAGLRLEDISIQDIPAPVMFEALKTEAIDFVHVGEPWVTRILRTGRAVLWLPAHKVIPNFQWAVLFYGPNLLYTNPETGRRFMVAYLKAVRQYNEGKTARNLEILVKYTKLDQTLLQEACWPAIRNDGDINPDSILDFQNWGKEKGVLNTTLTEKRFWDKSFVKYANQVLGSLTQ